MIFDVMSEREAIQFAKEEDILPSIIISIRNPNDDDIVFHSNEKIKGVLHLKFLDTELDRADAIQKSHATQIAEFVNEHYDEVDSVVVHCLEGISRSGGVTAALMKHYLGDDQVIWSSSNYEPNKRCYTLLLEALNEL